MHFPHMSRITSITIISALPAFSCSAFASRVVAPSLSPMFLVDAVLYTYFASQPYSPSPVLGSSAISRLPLTHAMDGGAFPYAISPVRQAEYVPCATSAVISTTMYTRRVNVSDPTRRVMRIFSLRGQPQRYLRRNSSSRWVSCASLSFRSSVLFVMRWHSVAMWRALLTSVVM
ncbi:hypothetical protein BV20DRAFT_112658 [Pilatotrama ljubarskyi]|nr:hypothetical protein BV20DRAFT_112658 [Pilatotrama ljubarskyi]